MGINGTSTPLTPYRAQTINSVGNTLAEIEIASKFSETNGKMPNEKTRALD